MSDRYKVWPNDNPKEREDARGKIRVLHRRTWWVVDTQDRHSGNCVELEYTLKRDAKRKADEMNQRGRFK